MMGKEWLHRRIIASLLAAVILVQCAGRLDVHAAATKVAGGTCGEISWELNSDGALIFSGSGNFMSCPAEQVPWAAHREKIKSVEFKMAQVAGGDISNYFSECTNLKTVNIFPNGITGMNGSFENCTALTKVGAVPDTVQSMNRTFKNCAKLNCALRVPEHVVAAEQVFDGCRALAQTPQILSEQIFDLEYMFRDTAITAPPHIPKQARYMEGCFYGCQSLENPPSIPDGVTDMAYCFYGCGKLLNAPTLPKRVKYIQYAFWNCESMKNAPDIPLFVEQMQNCLVGCRSASGTMTIYAVITEKKYYNQFAGDTGIYDPIGNFDFLGGGGSGLTVFYTGQNKDYYMNYLTSGWNCGGLGLNGECGKLRVGSMIASRIQDCDTDEVGAFSYTGTAHTPKPRVYYGNTQLVEGKDFQYSYADNANAGTASLIIDGMGGFTGRKTISFVIYPLALKSVKATGYSGTYDGNPHSISVQCDPGATVQYGTKEGVYNSATCPQYIMPGTYTVYYRVTKTNYEPVSGRAQVVIKQAECSVTAKGFSGEYDGNPHSIQVSANAGAAIKYGTKAGAYTTTVCPVFVKAGTYTVYYEVSKAGYRTQTGSQKVIITKKEIPDIQFPTASKIQYGERLGNSVLKGGSSEYGTFEWQTPEVIPGVGNEGFSVIFRVADSENYDFSKVRGFEKNMVVRKIPITVEPAKGILPEFHVDMLAAGDVVGMSGIHVEGNAGGKLEWESPTQKTEASTALYNIRFTPDDCVNYDWSGYSGYDAREGTVLLKTEIRIVAYPDASPLSYGKALGESRLSSSQPGAEYHWQEPGCIPQQSGYYCVVFRMGDEQLIRKVWLDIERARPQYDIPKLPELVYNPLKKLKDIPLPDGWQWMQPEAVPSVESGTYEAVFTPEDTEHYYPVVEKLPMSVQKANPQVNVPFVVVPYREDQKLDDISLPSGWSWKDGSIILKIGKHEYEAVYTPKDINNYHVLRCALEVEHLPEPTGKPTSNPAGRPTPNPVVKPTSAPIGNQTPEPTGEPTLTPTLTPTGKPTMKPVMNPTSEPTFDPAVESMAVPTVKPMPEVTGKPTPEPTLAPTEKPTLEPAGRPTSEPTAIPTSKPVSNPKAEPTPEPIAAPVQEPGFPSILVSAGEDAGSILADIQEEEQVTKELAEGASYEKKISALIQRIDKAGREKDMQSQKKKRVKILKIRKKGRMRKVKWKKINHAAGYQVAWFRKKGNKKGETVKNIKKCCTVLPVKGNRVRYIRVRAVFQGSGKRVYGKWSKAKKIV